MKKLWMGAALAALMAIVGCEGGGGGAGSGTTGTTGTTGSSTTTASTGKKLRIGVSVPAADHGWTAGIKWWADQAMAMYPDVEWTFQTAENPDKQIKDIETMLVKGLDGMVILATESAPVTPAAKQVHERGVYLVSVDRGFLEPVADLFVEGDNEAFGRKSAEFMVKQLNGQGKIVILEGIPSTVNTDRVKAARAVFAANPGIEVLDSQSGMWNREKAQNVMQTMLQKHPKIDAVWASDDDMALGVEAALKEAGRDKEMWILGGAGMKEIIKRVMDKDPMYPANITYSPSMIAVGIHMAVANLRDGKQAELKKFMPRHIKLDVDLITPDNAKDFYFADAAY